MSKTVFNMDKYKHYIVKLIVDEIKCSNSHARRLVDQGAIKIYGDPDDAEITFKKDSEFIDCMDKEDMLYLEYGLSNNKYINSYLKIGKIRGKWIGGDYE